MNFKTHNEKRVEINGTHLQGYLDTTYAKLVELFGQPTESDGYKVDVEWHLEFDDGVVATIYNWKNGPNYTGNRAIRVDSINEWHIGGHNQLAAVRVLALAAS